MAELSKVTDLKGGRRGRLPGERVRYASRRWNARDGRRRGNARDGRRLGKGNAGTVWPFPPRDGMSPPLAATWALLLVPSRRALACR
jgi:hypothetical protein